MKILFPIVFIFALLFIVAMSKGFNQYFDPKKDHHTRTGFTNPYLSQNEQKKSFYEVLKMMSLKRPKPQYQSIVKLNVDEVHSNLDKNISFITWIGHSTMLISIKGRTILTDPIFSDRCSPVQFAGPERYTPPSIDIKSLPRIDMIFISHNHYDHLDLNTVKLLRENTSTMWYVPLGLKSWFEKLNVKNVIELDWFDEIRINDVEIICLPSQHWTKRSFFKSFDTLWSSWLIKIEDYKFWFAGDTGYNNKQFKQIGNLYGPIDLAAIPIGAYEPRWFMKNFHVNPKESILIHKDIKAIKSFGMHFGTFVLTTEPILDPGEKIKKHILNDRDFIGDFVLPEHGKIYILDV